MHTYFYLLLFGLFLLFMYVSHSFNSIFLKSYDEGIIGVNQKSNLIGVNYYYFLTGKNGTTGCIRDYITINPPIISGNLVGYCYKADKDNEIFLPYYPITGNFYEITRGCQKCEKEYINENGYIFIKEVFGRLYYNLTGGKIESF